MIRTDGIFEFYKIQHQWEPDGEWVFSSYGEPDTGSKIDTFTASGKCWQLTGEHGVFAIENAIIGLKKAKKKVATDYKAKKISRKILLRLVYVKITQKTSPIAYYDLL